MLFWGFSSLLLLLCLGLSYFGLSELWLPLSGGLKAAFRFLLSFLASARFSGSSLLSAPSQLTWPISSDKSRRRSTTKGYPPEGAAPAGNANSTCVAVSVALSRPLSFWEIMGEKLAH